MSQINNRKILIGSTSKKLDEDIILGHRSKSILPILSVLIEAIRYCTEQYNSSISQNFGDLGKYEEKIKFLNIKLQILKYKCKDVCIYKDRFVKVGFTSTAPTIQDNLIELPILNEFQDLNFTDVVYSFNDPENNLISNVVVLSKDSENTLKLNTLDASINTLVPVPVYFTARYKTDNYIYLIKNTGDPCTSNIIEIDKSDYDNKINSNWNVLELFNANQTTFQKYADGAFVTETLPSIDLGTSVDVQMSVKVQDNNPINPLFSNVANIILRYTSECIQVLACTSGITKNINLPFGENYTFLWDDFTSDVAAEKVKITSLLLTQGALQFDNTDIISLPIILTKSNIQGGNLIYVVDTLAQNITTIEVGFNVSKEGDSNFCTETSIIEIKKEANPIIPPVILGQDLNLVVPLPDSITSSNMDIGITYPGLDGYTILWELVSGDIDVQLNNPIAEDLSLSNLKVGVYVVKITVTTNVQPFTVTENYTITVTSNYTLPTIDAGSDKSITLPVNFSSAIATNTGIFSSILWSQASGPNTAIINNIGSLTPSFDSLVEGIYQFTITGSDNYSNIVTDTMQVTVSPPQPTMTVHAGNPITITLPINNTASQAIASNSTGTVTYLWSQISGPNTGGLPFPTNSTGVFNTLIEGIYVFQVQATDDNGTATDTVQITVLPSIIPFSIDVGADVIITLPTNSSGTQAIPTGGVGVITYVWTQLSGPNTALLTTPNTNSVGFTQLIEGVYVFQCVATDDNGTATDTIQVIVEPEPIAPLAITVPNENITLPINSVILQGVVTSGSATSYSWSQVSGPTSATITNGTTITPTMSNLFEGSYVFEIVGTQSVGANVIVSCTVTVNPALQELTITVQNTTITLPVNSVQGAGIVIAGTASINLWTQVSGPNTATIVSGDTTDPLLSGLIQGAYVFNWSASDGVTTVNVDKNVTVTI